MRSAKGRLQPGMLKKQRPSPNAPVEWTETDCNQNANGNLLARVTSMPKTATDDANEPAKVPRRFWQSISRQISNFTEEHFCLQKHWWKHIIRKNKEENRPLAQKVMVTVYRVYELYRIIIFGNIAKAKRTFRTKPIPQDEIDRQRIRGLGSDLGSALRILDTRRYLMADSGALPDALRACDCEIRQLELWKDQCRSTIDVDMVYDQLRKRGFRTKIISVSSRMGSIDD